MQVPKRLIESVELELTKQDRLAIFAFLSAIAVADKKVTSEENDLINLVSKELELEDVLPSSEIDKEIKKYRDSPEEYKRIQDSRAEIQEDEADDLVGLIGKITDHYENLAKDFTSALLRLRVLGKLNAR